MILHNSVFPYCYDLVGSVEGQFTTEVVPEPVEGHGVTEDHGGHSGRLFVLSEQKF